jgi:hypothetical protein
MVNAKLIHEYLDGEIDRGLEEILFAQLQSDSEMRKELNTQMKIVAIAQRDKAMTIPPPALTNSLFNKLGYDLPMNGPVMNSEKGFFRKNMMWLLLLLLAISTATTVTTVYFANRNSFLNKEIAKMGRVDNSKSIPVTSSFEGKSNDANLAVMNNLQVNNSSDGNNNYLISKAGKYGNNVTPDNKNNNGKNSKQRNLALGYNNESGHNDNNQGNFLSVNSNNSDDLLNQNLIIKKSDLSKPSDNNKIRYLTKHNKFNNYGSGFTNNNSFIANLGNSPLYLIEKSKINFQIKGFSTYSSTPDISIGNSADFFENFAISGWYQINSFHSFGIEIGNEKFSQEFTTNNNLVYKQQPSLLWIGASYRYSIKEIIVPYIIYPYVQQFVGTTTVGPLLKTQAGLVFNLYGPISLVGGVEYGILLFNVDSKIYNTSKFNTFGGVSINF